MEIKIDCPKCFDDNWDWKKEKVDDREFEVISCASCGKRYFVDEILEYIDELKSRIDELEENSTPSINLSDEDADNLEKFYISKMEDPDQCI